MYLDLWHGEARDAYLAEDPSAKKPAFTLRAPLEIWKGVLDKKNRSHPRHHDTPTTTEGQYDENHESAQSGH